LSSVTPESSFECRVCGTALRIVQRVRGLCDDPECRRRDVPHQLGRRRDAAAADARALALKRWPRAAGFPLVLLPAHPRRPVPLPEARRSRFRAHLERIAQEASAAGRAESAEESTAATHGIAGQDARLPVVASACAFCAGRCCQAGGDTAWLEPATFLRVLRERADLDSDRLAKVYLEHVPTESFEQSCLFHTALGCALPREIRSKVCNQYICAELAELLDVWKDTSGRCLVAAADRFKLYRIGAVDGHSIYSATAEPSG